MTTSGVYTYSLSRDDISTAAMRKLGVIADGQTPSALNLTNTSQALNTLVAQFRALGMPLWARNTYTFSPTAGTQLYQIGTGKTLNTPYPLKMLQAYRIDSTGTTKIPMEIVANFNFNIYPTNSGGSPIQMTYQPKVNYGEIQLWPVPDATAASQSTITIVYQTPFQYFTSSTDTADFPEEWYLPLIYNLAVLIAPEWGIPLPDRQALQREAKEYLQTTLEFGTEDGSLFLQPDISKNYYKE